MRDRYEPPTDPAPWPAIPPGGLLSGTGDPYADLDWDPYYPAQFDRPPDEARDQGLRRLSMLTLHATGLSVVTAIGFAAVFASTAHAQTSTVVTAKPTLGPAAASGTPSPGPTPTHKKKHHHHKAAPTTAPTASAAAAPPPAPTLAPPTTAPAAAPPTPAPAPTQTTSSGSHPA
jgi:hypothetical protein